MKTFLDTHKEFSKTFLVYGNLNDTIICSDLTERNSEQYLVKLLKSRGYEHIVFFGEANTKGKYCLDDESGIFFFRENWRYAEDVNESEEDGEEKRKNLRYADRDCSLAAFLEEISPYMLDPDSHMAIVFYDIFTSNLGGSRDLMDSVLNVWEQRKDADNICLFLAPETVYDTGSIVQYVSSIGLQSKFLYKNQRGEFSLNPNVCFQMGFPQKDEIKNLLRRLAIRGTTKKYKKIQSLSGADMDKLAETILFCCRCRKLGSKSDEEFDYYSDTMRKLKSTLENYIDDMAGDVSHIELTKEMIEDAWQMTHGSNKNILEEFNRPGWEKVYELMNEIAKKVRNQRSKMEDVPPEQKKEENRWCIGRFVTETDEVKVRIKIPNIMLLGNPGTGKTTIARLTGQFFHELGLLEIGHTVEVTRENLTSSYIAGVPKATMACVNKAEEGILFIDEAHALGRKDGCEGHDGTGKEVVSTLNAAMTSPNHHFSVIIAGYEDDMESVFKLDKGFRRRFDYKIVLDDYKPELLLEILLKEIEKQNGVLSQELQRDEVTGKNPLECMIDRIYRERDRKRFGNAADIITLADHVCGNLCEGNELKKEDFLSEQITEEWFEPYNPEGSIEKVLEEMESELVGMDKIKGLFRDLVAEIEEELAYGKKPEQISLKPILLLGNPGVGKTTIATMLSKLYFHMGVLGTKEPVVVTASQMASRYQGGSQEKILEYIEEVQDKNGLLFVDEVHELCNPSFDGKGAMKAFIAPLTDKEHPFMAVFAGYTSHRQKLLELDPGLYSRVRIIELDDYTGEELAKIFELFLDKSGLKMEDEVKQIIQAHCDNLYDIRLEHSGNARQMKDLLDEMNLLRRNRCKEMKIPFGTEESRNFIIQDIPEEISRNLSSKSREEEIERLEGIRMQMKRERVGAEPLKLIIDSKIDALLYNVKYPSCARRVEPGHYFFKGNPGCGKTTGAQFLAKYYAELGILKTADLLKISVSDLIGQYLGETGAKTKSKLQEGIHKVLLIDEAYMLSDDSGHANSYKQDALTELVNYLDDEQYRKMSCIVFAGYNGDLDSLYEENQGLKSRIREIEFADFTIEECMKIIKSMAEKDGVTIEAEGHMHIQEFVRRMKQRDGFANGRTIRKFYELLVQAMQRRCIQENYSEDDVRVTTILKEDIPEWEQLMDFLNM